MCVVADGFVAPPSETLKFRKLVVLQATARVRGPGNVLMLNGLGHRVEATLVLVAILPHALPSSPRLAVSVSRWMQPIVTFLFQEIKWVFIV